MNYISRCAGQWLCGAALMCSTVGLHAASISPSLALVAGQIGGSGYLDGTMGSGAGVRFQYLDSIARDSAGNLYVGDSCAIRKISSHGEISTLAGGPSPASCGSRDGTGAAALIYDPRYLIVDGAGNIYFSQTSNNIIRKVTASGVVTTIAGVVGGGLSNNAADGPLGTGRFGFPRGIALASDGSLYIGDRNTKGGGAVRKLSPSGMLTTVAGTLTSARSSVDGPSATATFNNIGEIVIDAAGNLYVDDYGGHKIRKIGIDGSVTAVAGNGVMADIDGNALTASLCNPFRLAFDANGNLLIGELNTGTCGGVVRSLSPFGVLSTVAGQSGKTGTVDGTASSATFDNFLLDIAPNPDGGIYVTDTATIRLIKNGNVTTAFGLAATTGSKDGIAAAAQFNTPAGMVIDASGTIFVADSGSNVIRKVGTDGSVSTFAGQAGQQGIVNGAGTGAKFNRPLGLAMDSGGNLYVADSTNFVIRKITPAGVVSTFAGTSGVQAQFDGTGTAAGFGYPTQVAIDKSDNLYVADTAGTFGYSSSVYTQCGTSQCPLATVVRKISGTGTVTTLGKISIDPNAVLLSGSVDGNGSSARFCDNINGIAADGSGNVYLTDVCNNSLFSPTGGSLRRIDGSGNVSTLAGGTGSATFAQAGALAVDSTGTIWISDLGGLKKSTPTGAISSVFGTPSAQVVQLGGSPSLNTVGGMTFDGNGNLLLSSENAILRLTFSSSDCLFNWAERTYPQAFGPAGLASATYAPYYFRFYSGTATYLATSSVDNHIWVLGPISGNKLLDVGPLAGFLSIAGCQ